MQGGEDF